MNTIRFTSRAAFVAALEERRAFWREYDKRQAREHKAAEKQWLNDARAKMRDCLKLDYEGLKAALGSRYYGELRLGELPRCPSLMEHELDRVIAALKVTQGKAFTVSAGQGAWSEAHRLLTWDPDAQTAVC